MTPAAWPLLVVLAQAPVAPAAPPGASPLVRAALSEGGAYAIARDLGDTVGARLAGSPGAAAAVIWAEAAMKRAGLTAVRREPVTVRAWRRGPARATLRADAGVPGSLDQPLALLALGGSVATPPEGIEADVVEVPSLAALEALGARARGAIVFVNHEMASDPHGSGYRVGSAIRFRAPVVAARLGARALVMRSAGTGYHRLPHTGVTESPKDGPAIPSAALAAEDAERLHRRIATRGRARLALAIAAEEGPPTTSHNVIGEVAGGARKDEIVLIGAHLDSWDVGQGALDDAAGVGIALDSARLIAKGKPARTVRVVFFMSEEVDGAGAAAYANAHKDEMGRHVAALEADSGDGKPLRYGVTSGESALPLVTRWVTPLAPLVPAEVVVIRQGGADTRVLQKAGVPILEIAQDHSHYFDWHHTEGDTVDKLDPHSIAIATAAFGNLAQALANAPERLARTPRQP